MEDRVFIKTCPDTTPEQIAALFAHAQALHAALANVPGIVFPQPLSCTDISVSYNFVNLPPCLLPQVLGQTCPLPLIEKTGQMLAHIHKMRVGTAHLLHSDFVPHNIFVDPQTGVLYLIDPHPPLHLPYRSDLLYGDPTREVAGFVFSLVSDVGIKHTLRHTLLYRSYAQAFLRGYRNVAGDAPFSFPALLSYARDVYRIKRAAGFSVFASQTHCVGAILITLFCMGGAR